MWAVVGLGFYSGTSINIKKLKVMKQTEFEQKLIELKSKDRELLKSLRVQQVELKEEIANIGRQIHDLFVCRKKKEQMLHGINLQIMKVETDRREAINAFKQENWSEERKLSEVSDWCLVNELVARGFSGTITNDEKDPEFMTNLSKKFASGKFITPPILDELRNDGEQVQD